MPSRKIIEKKSEFALQQRKKKKKKVRQRIKAKKEKIKKPRKTAWPKKSR